MIPLLNRAQKICFFLSCLSFQVQTEVSVDTKHQTLQGVAFPIAKEALQALEKLKNKQLNYVQLVNTVYAFPF